MTTKRTGSARRALPVPELAEREHAGRHLTSTLSFLTPVFGGGVRVNSEEHRRQIKDHDPVTPVRSASLRGQLREWWRRTCGFDEDGDPLPLSVLRAREAVIWGWASTRSEPRRGWVSVEVDGSRLRHSPVTVLEVRGPRWVSSRGSGVAYGTFPLQPPNGNAAHQAGELHEWRGTFDVTLRADSLAGATHAAARAAWPDDDGPLEARLWDEVERAWLAWTTFGGFGGRTRRGFGAVRLKEDGVPLRTVLGRLGWGARCTTIGGTATSDRTFRTPMDALEAGLAKLKDFRQGRDLGRNPGTQPHRPGRSRWPEPDELRRLTSKHAPQHPPAHPVGKFPRAAFGLPIIFQFKDRGDPQNTSLQPVGAERLASPLVIRPVADGTDIKALVLRLPSRVPVDDILSRLTLRASPNLGLTGVLDAAEQDEIQPLREHRGAPSSGEFAVFEPFFRYFRGNVQ
ncbi:MAG: hypothetical protein H6736_21925 [Alphaproteobacteria bacterium]|nr:hypothetical protein [Alphaproteobacteria bacterium]